MILTLCMVAHLREGDLILKLDLMSDDVPNVGGPSSIQRVVPSDPFCTDVGVDLYSMRPYIR